MPTVESATYNRSNQIEAVIDGVTYTIPDNTTNRYRQLILNWERSGNRVSSYTPPSISITSVDVDTERDTRIDRGFMYQGKLIAATRFDRENITGAALLASFAKEDGYEANDYLWADGETQFEWITADNTLLPLDVFEMIEMAKTCAIWQRKHIFAAKQLKDTSPIPSDYYDNSYWPSLNPS